MRRLRCILAVGLLALAACGGGGDDDDTIAAEPISVDPCDLLDEATAAELVGSDDVELSEVDTADGGTGCGYTVGSTLAASLTLEPGSSDDLPGASLAGAVVDEIALGDGGRVVKEDDRIQVVYVVREIVVRIEVSPASGEVDDDTVDKVIGFAEETEAPIVEAVTGEAPAPTTATTEGSTTTTTEAETTTTTAAEEPGEGDAIDEGWSATASHLRDQVGEQFVYVCPPGGPPSTVWGSQRSSYTDDSSVCTAAVHAGAITVEDGGRVRIQMTPGLDAYTGGEANGITALDWPTPWPGSYIILGTED